MLNEKDEDGYKITDRSTAKGLKVAAKVSVQTTRTVASLSPKCL